MVAELTELEDIRHSEFKCLVFMGLQLSHYNTLSGQTLPERRLFYIHTSLFLPQYQENTI